MAHFCAAATEPSGRSAWSIIPPPLTEYAGMSGDQLRRLKELEKENERLRRAVSDLTLDKQILKEAAGGNF